MNLTLVILFELVFEFEAVWFGLAGSDVQQIALEAGHIVHISEVAILPVKYVGFRDRAANAGR